MSDLEERLRQEAETWQQRFENAEAQQKSKARTNTILALFLGSSLLTAALTEGFEILNGEFQEDVKICELGLDFVKDVEKSDLDNYTSEEAEEVRRTVVKMISSSCSNDDLGR